MFNRSPLLRHDLLTAFDDNATGGVRCWSAVQTIGTGGRVLDDGSLVHTDCLACLGLELGTCTLQLFDEALIVANELIEHAARQTACIDVALPMIAGNDAALSELPATRARCGAQTRKPIRR